MTEFAHPGISYCLSSEDFPSLLEMDVKKGDEAPLRITTPTELGQKLWKIERLDGTIVGIFDIDNIDEATAFLADLLPSDFPVTFRLFIKETGTLVTRWKLKRGTSHRQQLRWMEIYLANMLLEAFEAFT
jgi:hypothetical protein